MSWRARWETREYVRNSIWIVPAILATLAVALGIILPEVDKETSINIGIGFGSDAARGVLGSLAGGMITFTGFVFSILLLAVQFGSSQFSPRMLRRFLRDPTTKIAFGVFVATFIYSLLVLRTVGTADSPNFVPDFSVVVALALLLLSMAMFLRLISATTQGLRVAAVLADLSRDSLKAIERAYPTRTTGEKGEAETEPRSSTAPFSVVTYEHRPGILQTVHARGLVALAHRSNTVIDLVPPIGDFLIPGEPLFHVYGGEISGRRLQGTVAVGDERTLKQDPAFAFRLLADISSKALSPGVNDPTTAIQALDQIELLLRVVGQRKLTPGELRDHDGKVRVRYSAPSWEDFLALALDETRQFGTSSVQVSRRLFALLSDLREVVPAHRRPAVDAEIQRLTAGVDRSFHDEGDRRSAATSDRQGIGSSRDPERLAA